MTNYTKNKQKGSEEAGIDVRQLLRRASRLWYIFIIVPILMCVAAWFYLRYQIPVYEVKSSVMIKDETNKEGVTASDLISKELGLSGTKKLLVDESKIMTSYSVIEKVVRDLKLNNEVYLKGTIKTEEIYGKDCPFVLDSIVLRDSLKDFKAAIEVLDNTRFEFTPADGAKQTCSFGTIFSNQYGDFLINKKNNSTYDDRKDFNLVCKSVEKTAREIIKSINIELPKKESNLIEPSIKTPTPEKAKAILQSMVEVYNEISLSDKKEVSQNTIGFIKNRLLSLTNELSGVEKNVEEYKRKEGITGDGAPDIAYFFNKLDEYDSEQVKLEVQNSILNGIQGILTKNDPTFDLLPTNLELKSSNLQSQISEYNKLVLDRGRLAKVAGDNNPTLRTLTDDIRNMKKAIIDNISRVKQENASLLSQAKSKNAQFTSRLGKTSRNERELTDIKRQQNIKEGLYLFLLQKQEETAISMVGAVADARIIDRPIVGELPISKKKSIVYLAAISAGIFLSLIYVLISGLFLKTVQSVFDIKTNTFSPILAKIPNCKVQSVWVVQDGSRTVITEAFRTLRSNLQHILPQNNEDRGHAILVTSSKSDEGKSFLTLNLGMTLAMANKRTVIINFDLRRPKISTYFPYTKGAYGITDYLNTELYPHEIIQPSGSQKDLFFIHTGPLPNNPAEIMLNPKLAQLFAYLKENFEFIIISTPPVGLVADAFSLKKYVDLTLFVVRDSFTKKSDLYIINEINDEQKLPNLTVVYNDIKEKNKGDKNYYGDDLKTFTEPTKTKKSILSKEWIKQNFL